MLFRLGLMALASSGGKLSSVSSILACDLGTMIVEECREPSFGRLGRPRLSLFLSTVASPVVGDTSGGDDLISRG